MTLWEVIRCWLRGDGACDYDPDKDEWLKTVVRPQREASEQKVEAIRRLKATGSVFGDRLGNRVREEH